MFNGNILIIKIYIFVFYKCVFINQQAAFGEKKMLKIITFEIKKETMCIGIKISDS